jgi:hypothetical protein
MQRIQGKVGFSHLNFLDNYIVLPPGPVEVNKGRQVLLLFRLFHQMVMNNSKPLKVKSLLGYQRFCQVFDAVPGYI